MFLKFLVTAIVLAALWMLMFRATGRGERRAAPPRRQTKLEQLVKCRDCGIYLPAGQSCGCSDRD